MFAGPMVQWLELLQVSQSRLPGSESLLAGLLVSESPWQEALLKRKNAAVNGHPGVYVACEPGKQPRERKAKVAERWMSAH